MFDFNKILTLEFFLGLFKRYWYLFLVSILLSICISYLYLKYTPSTYSTSVLVEVGDKSSKGSMSNALSEMGMFSELKNLDNEIFFVKSYPLVLKSIQSLNFNVQYFVEGDVRKLELYRNEPVSVRFLDSYHNHLNAKYNLKLSEGEKKVAIYNIQNDDELSPCLLNGKIGDTLVFSGAKVIFTRNKLIAYNRNVNYFFKVFSSEDIAQQFVNRVDVSQISEESTILQISLTGLVPERDVDFLNQLAADFVNKDLIDKDNKANNTLRFIQDQLDEVYVKLTGAESSLEKFRNSNNMFNVETSTEKIAGQFDDLEKEKAELNVQENYYKYLLEYVSNKNNNETIIAPSAIGVSDPLLIKTITDLNSIYSQKASLYHLENDNPTIREINNKISSLRLSLVENVKNILKGSDIRMSDIKSRIGMIESKLSRLPNNEREFVGIKREFDLNNHIYNYLLEKRAETGIAKATHTPENEILEPARINSTRRVAPISANVYKNNILIGLFLPLLFLIALQLFNSTIQNSKEIEEIVSLPILTEIVSYRGNEKSVHVLYNKPKSSLAESFRNLRINLQFLNQVQKSNQVIAFTSSISREGKTFGAINTAASLAFSGKKVILIGADLRKPRLDEEFDIINKIGLSNYLSKNAELEDVIQKSPYENLSLIMSGPIPPNPAELLESPLFNSMIEVLKQKYDYVIIDTSPLGLVPDYFIINKSIDITLFMVRQAYTEKKLLENLERLVKTEKLKRTYILLNDYDLKSGYDGSSFGYGYGYGYGNGSGYVDEDETTTKKWFNKLKSKLKIS